MQHVFVEIRSLRSDLKFNAGGFRKQKKLMFYEEKDSKILIKIGPIRKLGFATKMLTEPMPYLVVCCGKQFY